MDREEALKRQFIREARIGISLIGVTLAVFIGVAYHKLRGSIESDISSAPSYDQAGMDSSPSTLAQTEREKNLRLDAATRSVIDQVPGQMKKATATTAPELPAPRTFAPPILLNSNQPPPRSPTPNASSQLAEGVLGKDDAAQVDQTKPVDFPNKPPPPEEGLTSRATPLPVRNSTMPLMQLPRATPPTSFPVRRASDDRSDDLLAGSTVRPIESHIPMQKEATLEEETIERQPATDQIAQTAAQTSLSVVPTSAEDGVVVVQLNAGESLWTVAQRHYGDGRYFRALAAFNQLEDEDSDGRSPRTLLQLPTAEALRNAFPELLPANSESPSEDAEPATSPGADYVTQAGDTLFSIARDQLGQASRYVELFERNKSILPENTTAALKLPRGIRLKLLPK